MILGTCKYFHAFECVAFVETYKTTLKSTDMLLIECKHLTHARYHLEYVSYFPRYAIVGR